MIQDTMTSAFAGWRCVRAGRQHRYKVYCQNFFGQNFDDQIQQNLAISKNSRHPGRGKHRGSHWSLPVVITWWLNTYPRGAQWLFLTVLPSPPLLCPVPDTTAVQMELGDSDVNRKRRSFRAFHWPAEPVYKEYSSPLVGHFFSAEWLKRKILKLSFMCSDWSDSLRRVYRVFSFTIT